MPRTQFSLKAIMVIIAVLAVPLGMLVSGDYLYLVPLGGILVLPAVFACIGYLLRGWEGVVIGVLTGLVLFWLITQSLYFALR